MDRFRREHVHFLIVELGDVGELFLDVVGIPFLLEILERVGAHDAEIDSLEEQNVGHALNRAAADDRQHTEIVAVIERRGEIRTELHVGPGDGAGHDGDRVGVETLRGLHPHDVGGFDLSASMCLVKLQKPRRLANIWRRRTASLEPNSFARSYHVRARAISGANPRMISGANPWIPIFSSTIGSKVPASISAARWSPASAARCNTKRADARSPALINFSPRPIKSAISSGSR